MDWTLVVRTRPGALYDALRAVAGLQRVAEGPVVVRWSDGLAVVEGLGEATCREVAEALDAEAAIVATVDLGDEIDAWTRNPSSPWMDAGEAAEAEVHDWTDGEPHRFADWTPDAEAVLGASLIDGHFDRVDDQRTLRFVGSRAEDIEAAIVRVAAGEPWTLREVEGRRAVVVGGERVFVGADDLERVRASTPKPPDRDPSLLTVSLDPPGRFAIDDPSGPLLWGRHAVDGGRAVFDVRSRLAPDEVADLVRGMVETHREAFVGVSAVVVRQGTSEIVLPVPGA